jgi:Mrp family chromosome partitioning ATPase
MNSTDVLDASAIEAPLSLPRPRSEGVPSEAIEDAETYGELATAPSRLSTPCRDRYRLVALRLEAVTGFGRGGQGRVLVVTSPARGDGKTITTMNLGATLASELGRRVIVIDADLRRPRLARRMGLEARRGVGDVLRGRCTVEDVLWKVGDDELWVVPGNPDGDDDIPARGLSRLVESLRTKADYVLLDTPAVDDSADAPALARVADGVVLVVRSGQTRKSILAGALDALLDAPLCGVILNDHRGPAEEARLLEPKRSVVPALPPARPEEV